MRFLRVVKYQVLINAVLAKHLTVLDGNEETLPASELIPVEDVICTGLACPTQLNDTAELDEHERFVVPSLFYLHARDLLQIRRFCLSKLDFILETKIVTLYFKYISFRDLVLGICDFILTDKIFYRHQDFILSIRFFSSESDILFLDTTYVFFYSKYGRNLETEIFIRNTRCYLKERD
eukprot:g4434.t1